MTLDQAELAAGYAGNSVHHVAVGEVVELQTQTELQGLPLDRDCPRTQVPPVGMLPYHKHRRIPYLYSLADVAALMTQARLTIPSPL